MVWLASGVIAMCCCDGVLAADGAGHEQSIAGVARRETAGAQCTFLRLVRPRQRSSNYATAVALFPHLLLSSLPLRRCSKCPHPGGHTHRSWNGGWHGVCSKTTQPMPLVQRTAAAPCTLAPIERPVWVIPASVSFPDVVHSALPLCLYGRNSVACRARLHSILPRHHLPARPQHSSAAVPKQPSLRLVRRTTPAHRPCSVRGKMRATTE